MKKFLSLTIAAIMSVSMLTACGSAAPASAPEATPAPAAPATTPAPAEPAAPAEPETDPVYDAAFGYFKNFPSDKNVIAAKDFLPKVGTDEDMFILDIRRPDDYNTSHVIGAVNLSFFTTDISDNLDKIPDDRPVYVYCYTGQTASQVTALLNLAGKTAKNVQSGFQNGIEKVEGYEASLDAVPVTLEDETYPSDAAVADALSEYFKAKMALDGTATANFNLKPSDVKQIIDDEDDSYLILSIRSAEDYGKGHIPTAINIPYGAGMQDALAELPTDQKIVVYCYSGQTSSQTTAILRMMGYEAYSMSGGMGNAEQKTGWLGAGYEVVAS